eukprot:2543341-Rhodomonas_salina.1
MRCPGAVVRRICYAMSGTDLQLTFVPQATLLTSTRSFRSRYNFLATYAPPSTVLLGIVLRDSRYCRADWYRATRSADAFMYAQLVTFVDDNKVPMPGAAVCT